MEKQIIRGSKVQDREGRVGTVQHIAIRKHPVTFAPIVTCQVKMKSGTFAYYDLCSLSLVEVEKCTPSSI